MSMLEGLDPVAWHEIDHASIRGVDIPAAGFNVRPPGTPVT
ncbi:hypothetical protein [Lentzea sp. NPDC004782]